MNEEDRIQIRSLEDCSIHQITELWNIGFQQYGFGNMLFRDTFQHTVRLGLRSIHPNLSVAAFLGDAPVGFVMVGLKDAFGQKQAWNGGTGVNPAFRGKGLGTRLLREAIQRLRAAGIATFSLEVKTENTQAIRAYERCGFKFVDKLVNRRRQGGFEKVPFKRSGTTAYRETLDVPELASRLAFYREDSSWVTHWFNAEGSQLLLAYDPSGVVCGYSIFRKGYSERGELRSIELTHCEADFTRDDGEDVTRFMLDAVMRPINVEVLRVTRYIPAMNVWLTNALTEAGFVVSGEENLMILNLDHS